MSSVTNFEQIGKDNSLAYQCVSNWGFDHREEV